METPPLGVLDFAGVAYLVAVEDAVTFLDEHGAETTLAKSSVAQVPKKTPKSSAGKPCR